MNVLDHAKLMYFSDGIRQVDYIVAFHFSSPSDEGPLKEFLTNLLQHGVNIEIEEGDDEPAREFSVDSNVHAFGKNKLIFAKLHVEWNYLLRIAEILTFQKAVKFNSPKETPLLSKSCSIEELLRKKVIIATFPLHEIYRTWIQWSTNLECHRTQDQQVQCILMKSCLMEFINVFLSLFTSILFRALNYGYPGQNLALFEPLEWPVWTGMFGVFYEAYIKCTVIVFVKSAFDWLPLSQVKKTVMERVRSSVFGRCASPQRVEIQSLGSSPTYKHCLDNFNLDTSGEHLLFQRQFNVCKRWWPMSICIISKPILVLYFSSSTKMPPQVYSSDLQ
ncbi:unnamed protein product [Taenia asiatica]|uniref:Anoct_dimer domain-containing protein n=1 Tax=Taenia asiatica TaxID=60517 RepID=A0A158R6M1_TAEAS|nr:unnamed protein product [Taenia asiatica]